MTRKNSRSASPAYKKPFLIRNRNKIIINIRIIIFLVMQSVLQRSYRSGCARPCRRQPRESSCRRRQRPRSPFDLCTLSLTRVMNEKCQVRQVYQTFSLFCLGQSESRNVAVFESSSNVQKNGNTVTILSAAGRPQPCLIHFVTVISLKGARSSSCCGFGALKDFRSCEFPAS